jgi:hypothetical protein
MRYQSYADATQIYGVAFSKLAEMPKAPESNESEGISGRVFADPDPHAQERARAETEHLAGTARMLRGLKQPWPKEASVLSVYGTALASK